MGAVGAAARVWWTRPRIKHGASVPGTMEEGFRIDGHSPLLPVH